MAPLLLSVPVSRGHRKPRGGELEEGARGLFLIPKQELATRKHCLQLTISFVVKPIFLMKMTPSASWEDRR